MLLLKRRVGESIVIGGNIRITIGEVRGGTVRIGIEAPSDMPVYRGELLDVLGPENERAVASRGGRHVRTPHLSDPVISFPHRIPGLGKHSEYLLYDVSETVRALVARDDSSATLLLTDPTVLDPNYPVASAMARYPFAEDDLAVAVVLTMPADGSTPTVNMAAPIVIGLNSRMGAQVILDGDHLPLRAPLLSTPTIEVHTP